MNGLGGGVEKLEYAQSRDAHPPTVVVGSAVGAVGAVGGSDCCQPGPGGVLSGYRDRDWDTYIHNTHTSIRGKSTQTGIQPR